MAEYDKGRLYWIKLTDRFISSDTVDFLMSQKDGAKYIVLYQMLCLKTVNNGGVLARQLGETLVPYGIEKIRRDCKWFSKDTVKNGLKLFKQLGLLYEKQECVLAISEFDRLIGSQTVGAERKAIQRQQKDNETTNDGQCGRQEVDICPPNCPPEKEKDKEINIITTTTTAGARACEAPTLLSVYLYFKANIDVDVQAEADKFYAYNERRGWDCLPDWQGAANVWIARIGG